MSEMVDRVAQAICIYIWDEIPEDHDELRRLWSRQKVGTDWYHNDVCKAEFRDLARLAIKAMKEPTTDMKAAAYNSCAGYDAPLHDEIKCNDLRWKASINAALGLNCAPEDQDHG